jgi:signal transduction histidine kinase/ligand-binding sensor domain-containing protein
MQLRGGILFLIICCLSSDAIRALDLGQAHRSYSRTIWTQKDGLPQDAIGAIVQTSDGYLWLGTEEGLARFDGYSFTIFNKDAGNLPSNSITALATGTDGTLWIGTANGLTSYKDNRFQSYSTADGLADNAITDLHVGHAGRLWILAGGALSRFDGAKITLVAASKDISVAPRAICEDGQGVMWVAGSGGLARLVEQRFVTKIGIEALRGNLVTRLVADRQGNLWLGGASGLIKYATNGTIRRYGVRDGLPDLHIRGMKIDRQGVLWVGTSSGLVRLMGDRFLKLPGPEGREQELVRCVYDDLEGNLWVGKLNGLERLRNNLFTTYGKVDGLAGDDPTRLYQDHSGRFWVGFGNNGLMVSSAGLQGLRSIRGFPSKEIFSIRETHDGELLIGTRDGLVRFRGSRFVTYTPADELNRRVVFDALEDSVGRTWLALPSGIGELEKEGKLHIIAQGGFQNLGWAISLLEGHDGELWAGTYGKGIWRIKGEEKRLFTTADGLSSNQIRSLYEDREGILWIATLGGGLNAFHAGYFRHFAAKDGLISDNVSEIVDDGESLWLGTTRGICRLYKHELLAFWDKKISSVRVTTYGVDDGLRSAQCAPGYVNANASRTGDGRLWFPTSLGLSTIDPNVGQVQEPAPIPRLIGVTVDGKTVRVASRVLLEPGTETLRLRYVAIHLGAPERVQYARKLEGVDPDWVFEGRSREVDYNTLRPGKYRFLLRAELPDGGPARETEYTFEQLPQFYERLWFRLLCAAAFITAIGAAYLVRIRQLRYRFALILEERARLARDIHDTLAQGFIGISSQLEAVSAAMNEDLSRAQQYLDVACKMVRHSITEARRSVFELRASELEGKDLAAALQSGAEAWTAGCGLTVDVDVAGVRRPLPDRVEQQLLRIAQEAITNVLKHAGATEIKISLSMDSDKVSLRISDNGQGFHYDNVFSSAAGHFGLIGMRERAEQLDGELRLTSRPGEGTEIEVMVPLLQ